MVPNLDLSTIGEALVALAAVLVIALVTFVLGRWVGRRMKGVTRLGLRDMERLAAPVTLLAVAGSAALLMAPTFSDSKMLPFATELVAVFAGFWLCSRTLDVFWITAEHSARVRHNQVARAVLMSARHVVKAVIWIGAAVTFAVKLGAAAQLYLVLGGLGAALAFAARDPLRNVFAFVNMIVDPPFQPGDLVRLEDFRGGIAAEGTVLSISLSSVTIETTARTRVVVSNLRASDLRVENLSMADRRRLELVLPVASELSTEELRTACDEIETELRGHPDVSSVQPPHVWLSVAPGGLHLKASLWLREASDRRDAQTQLLLIMRRRLRQPRNLERAGEPQPAAAH